MRRAKLSREQKWKRSMETIEDAVVKREDDHSLAFSDLIGFNEEEEKMRALLERIGRAKAMMERLEFTKKDYLNRMNYQKLMKITCILE